MPSRNTEVVRFRIQRGDYTALRSFAAQRGQALSTVLREALAQSPLLASLHFRTGPQPTPVAPLFASAAVNPVPAQTPPVLRPFKMSRVPQSRARVMPGGGAKGGMLSDCT